MKTNDLKICDKLKRNINKLGYLELTPIEEKAIPVILEEKDVIGIAKTGSGKTLAYSIPLIERGYDEKLSHEETRSLILVPTRELAMQVRNEINSVSSDSLRTVVIMGGIAQSKQVHDIKKGVDILVATPGRLKDLINQRKISVAKVDKIVLDEADTMLDMGFVNDIEFILSKTLTKRQVLLFTATMSKTIEDLSNKYLNDPVKIEIIPPKDEEILITEKLFYMDGKDKNDFLLSYISDNHIEEALIFTRTKIGADKLCNYLNSYNLKSVAIHSNKRQNERSRNLRLFKEKNAKFLIATDIAARGIDIKNLPYVINYNLPDQPELYIHRIGRTGRAGDTGIAVTICTPDERNYLKDIERLTKREIPLEIDAKYSLEYEKLAPKNNNRNSSNRNKKSSSHRNDSDSRSNFSSHRSNSNRSNFSSNRNDSDKRSNFSSHRNDSDRSTDLSNTRSDSERSRNFTGNRSNFSSHRNDSNSRSNYGSHRNNSERNTDITSNRNDTDRRSNFSSNRNDTDRRSNYGSHRNDSDRSTGLSSNRNDSDRRSNYGSNRNNSNSRSNYSSHRSDSNRSNFSSNRNDSDRRSNFASNRNNSDRRSNFSSNRNGSNSRSSFNKGKNGKSYGNNKKTS